MPDQLPTSTSIRVRRFISHGRFGVALALTLALGTTACLDQSGDGAVLVPAGPPLGAGGGKRGPPKNRYLAFRAKKRDAGATIRLIGLELRAPFRAELRLGDLSKKQRAWGTGTAGVSVLDPAGFVAFHAIKVSKSDADLLIDASSSPGGVVHPQVRLQDTQVAELAFEHTGTELVFEARRPGDADFVEVGRAAAAYTGPFTASFDILGMDKRGEAGLDDVLVLTSADPPDLSTPLLRSRHQVASAMHDLLRTLRAADRVTPDPTAAAAALADARGHLDAAATEFDAVGAAAKQAAKKVRGARKKIALAEKKLGKGKPATSTVSLLLAALKACGKGFAKLPRP